MNQQRSTSTARPAPSILLTTAPHLQKEDQTLTRNIQRWNSCRLGKSPKNLHGRKVAGVRPQSPVLVKKDSAMIPPVLTPTRQSPGRRRLMPIETTSPTATPQPQELPSSTQQHQHSPIQSLQHSSPNQPQQQHRHSPRRLKSEGWLDLPSFDDSNRRGLALPAPESHKPLHSPVRTSPRRMLSLQVDVQKRLVRSGLSVRSIEPEPCDFVAAMAKTGQSVRHINGGTTTKNDDQSVDGVVQDEAPSMEETVEEEMLEEEHPQMEQEEKPQKPDSAAAPPLRMASSMSNIPYLEPLVEEDSERNESEEFHLLAVPAQQLLTSISAVQEHTNEDPDESAHTRSIAIAEDSGRQSDAFAKRPRTQTPSNQKEHVPTTVAPPTVATSDATATGRKAKMGLISRLSMRFSRRGPIHQHSTRSTRRGPSMSCRNPSSQVATDCYGPPVLIPTTTTSTFDTAEVPTTSKQPPKQQEAKEISLPASPQRPVTLKHIPQSAMLTPPPKTTRPAIATRIGGPPQSRLKPPPPTSSRPLPPANSSNDPKDVVFSPPNRTKSLDMSFSSRRSPNASDSTSGSPPASPMKSIARSPTRSSPRRRLSRSFLPRHSIRSIISQRSIATNNAVSDGIYPQKGLPDTHKSPPRRRLVARLSFRLSQSDLHHDENGGPMALRTLPDPSNLQEKQEERRNLLSRMARQRDADSRTAEMSITHTRQMSYGDEDEEEDEVDEPGDDDREDELRFVPETVTFYHDANDDESAITDACTWAESSSCASLCSPSAGAKHDIKLPPCEIQEEHDTVSCLREFSGSFRMTDITRSASGKSLLDNSIVLDDELENDVNDTNDNDDAYDKEISVSLFHVSPGRREYPKMESLRAKTLVNLENSDGSLYLDDTKNAPAAAPAQTKREEEEDEVIPGDTMDENFYLAEIIKALEEQNRKTKQILRRKARSKPSEKYLVEL